MKRSHWGALAATPVVVTLAVLGVRDVRGSSHAEAPAVADDPQIDNTDVWAWKDSATTITILTGWNGLSSPAGGPNYKRWIPASQGHYEIHIDTNGDGVEDQTYRFTFEDVDNNTQTFLRVGSPSNVYAQLVGPGDPAQKYRQRYFVSRLTGSRSNPTSTIAELASAIAVAPPNTGPKFTKGRLNARYPVLGTEGYNQASLTPATAGNDYESHFVATPGLASGNGALAFVGPRQDAFFVDLGPTFDQLVIRTLGIPIPGGSTLGGVDVGQYGGGFNTLSGNNVEVIGVRVPSAVYGAGFAGPITPGTCVGVWSSASRRRVRVNVGNGGPNARPEVDSGPFVQVSRLGNPLVNELFIPFDRKDEWNAAEPRDDAARFGTYYLNPEPVRVINALYGAALSGVPPTTGRNELFAIFAPDTLKVRVDAGMPALTGENDLAFARLAAAANQSAQQVTGAPNGLLMGRTLADDVVDIYLQVAAGKALGVPFTGGFNNVLGDGCDWGNAGASAGIRVRNPYTFPYMGTPIDGQEIKTDWAQSPRVAR